MKAGREPFKRTKRINKKMLMLKASSILATYAWRTVWLKLVTTTAFNISII